MHNYFFTLKNKIKVIFLRSKVFLRLIFIFTHGNLFVFHGISKWYPYSLWRGHKELFVGCCHLQIFVIFLFNLHTLHTYPCLDKKKIRNSFFRSNSSYLWIWLEAFTFYIRILRILTILQCGKLKKKGSKKEGSLIRSRRGLRIHRSTTKPKSNHL